MFSKRSKKSITPAGTHERVFDSLHMSADRVGPVLCVTCLDEAITERESGIITNETEPLLDPSCKAIIVDLHRVALLSSAGIGMLVRLHKHITSQNGSFLVCSLNDDLAELFKMTRMHKLFQIEPDRETAIRAATT